MVRVKGPLFSLEASGTIGGTIVFSRWKGRDYVRRHAIPSNPRSGLQVGVRSVFGFIARDWCNLSDESIADWTAAAAADNITPLNAHIRDAVDRARRNLGWRMNTTDPDSTNNGPPENLTVTAQPRTLVLDWTPHGFTPASYCLAIYRALETGFDTDISNLIGVVSADVTTFTDFGLTPATAYHYQIRGISNNGTLSAVAVAGTGTPKA